MAKCPYLDEFKENEVLLGVYDCYCKLSMSHMKSKDLLVRYVCTDSQEYISCPVYKEEHSRGEKKEGLV